MSKDSWFSGANLYQGKEFPLDDYYSQVGHEGRNGFQQKTSWISHSTSVGPTKYEKPLNTNRHLNPEMKLGRISLIKWNCPPEFSMNHEWQVASGEESKERVNQMHREMQVVEAVYPNLSAIPPSPFEPLGKEIRHQDDDSTIPIIPLIPIEEAEELGLSIVAEGAPNTSVHSRPPDLPQGSSRPNINTPQIPLLGLLAAADGDVVADAASVALTALVKSQEMGDLIDKDLLIEILKNPQLIEELSNKTGSDTLSVLKPVTESLPLISPRPEMVKNSINDHRAPGSITAPVSGPQNTGTMPMINNVTNENGTPILWSSSVALPGSKPVNMMTKNLISENFMAQPAGSNPVTLSVPLPSAKSASLVPWPSAKPASPVPWPRAKPASPVPWPRAKPASPVPWPSAKPTSPVPWPSAKPASPVPWPRAKPTSPAPWPSAKPASPAPWPSKFDYYLVGHNNEDKSVIRPANYSYLGNNCVRSPSLGNTNAPPVSAPIVPSFKDNNYFKSLVKEHGERRENQQDSTFGKFPNDLPVPKPVNNVKLSERESKYQKACIYFNSSVGCRRGSTCLYRHIAADWPENPGWAAGPTGTKRLRL